MTTSFDGDMRRVVEPFERDHDRLRAELMASLPETVPQAPDAARPSRRRYWTGKTPMRRLVTRIALVGAVAATVLAIFGLWPSNGKGGIAWADVIRQIQSARTAAMRITTREPHIANGQEVTIKLYVRLPDQMRQEWPAAIAGKETVSILSGEQSARLYPADKRFERTADVQRLEKGALQKLLTTWCVDPAHAMGGGADVPALLGGGSGRLIPEGRVSRDGRKLDKYRLEITQPPSNPYAIGDTGITCYWFTPERHEVALITLEREVDSRRVETSTVHVQLDIPLGDELFSTAPPAGYQDATATTQGVATRRLPNLLNLLWTARMVHVSGSFTLPYSDESGKPLGDRTWQCDAWFDPSTGRSQMKRPTDVSSASSDPSTSYKETVDDGEIQMELNHATRTVRFDRPSPLRRKLEVRRSIDGFGGFFLSLAATQEVQRTGTSGEYDVWEGILDPTTLGAPMKLRILHRADTNDIGGVRVWMKHPGSDDWRLTYDIGPIDRNATPPPGLFAMAPPSGYTLENTREAATVVDELDYEGGVGMGPLSCNARISFRLPDGSILLAWSSKDSESKESQAPLFDGCVPGGPLPKLPIEFTELSQITRNGEQKYVGRHVAHAQHKGEFIEWGLYVCSPDQSPSHLNIYKVQHRFNAPAEHIHGSMQMAVSQPFDVDAASFDDLVRGAMATLSDNAVVPDHVTYENVMKLSRRIRESLGKP